jgi:hypothetical protein
VSRPRGQRLLIAQADRSPALGPPPDHLGEAERWAWRDIVAACPDVLRSPDAAYLEMIARTLAAWRAGSGDRDFLRLLYRMLGDLFVPLRARRRLLFPDRPRRE